MEDLIRRTLEESDDDDDAGTVERVSERIAAGRKVTGKPMPLKRYETT
jgi:serine/threonine-protein phosphatase 2B catalytic subunit